MKTLRDLQQTVAQAKALAEREERKQRTQRLKGFEEAAQNALGEELLEELDAEYDIDKFDRTCLTLRYQGEKLNLGDLRNAPEEIAQWTQTIDQQLQKQERKRQMKIQYLQDFLEGKHDDDELWKINQLIQELEYSNHETLIEKVQAQMEAVRNQRKAQKKVQQEFERREAERKLNRRAQELRAELEKIASWDEYTVFEEDLYFEEDTRVIPLIQDELQSAKQYWLEKEEAIEKKRLAKAQEHFSPFSFYRVHYGVVASEGPETYVQTQSFRTLHPEPTNGWWQPILNRPPVKIAHLTKIERIDVTTPDEVPGWCPTIETEWGYIYVPPENATFGGAQ